MWVRPLHAGQKEVKGSSEAGIGGINSIGKAQSCKKISRVLYCRLKAEPAL